MSFRADFRLEMSGQFDSKIWRLARRMQSMHHFARCDYCLLSRDTQYSEKREKSKSMKLNKLRPCRTNLVTYKDLTTIHVRSRMINEERSIF